MNERTIARTSKARRDGVSKDLILLILDIQGIEDRLREFERKYRLAGRPIHRGVFRAEPTT